MKTFYEILNISRNASTQEIIDAYRKRCIETHPDKGGNENDFLNVRKGYEILSNSESRAAYDRFVFQKEKEELEKQLHNLKMQKEAYERSKGEKANNDGGTDNLFKYGVFLLLFFVVMLFIMFFKGNRDKDFIPQIETNSSIKSQYKNQDKNKDKDIKWIYDELSKNGYIVPYDIFLDELKNPDMIRYYYNETKTYDLKIGTFDDFNILILREGILDKRLTGEDSNVVKATTKSQSNKINRINADIDSNSIYDYEETTFKTGDSPYSQYYGEGQVDRNSLSKLTIVNNSTQEAVVLLVEDNGHVIRNVYISNGSQYSLSNIPEGHYRIKVMYGNSWYSKKDNGLNFPKGGFMKNVSFSKSKDNDLFDYIFEETYDGISYPTYSITLHKVKNGNMKTESIGKNEFFN